jgi:hypothetical protein
MVGHFCLLAITSHYSQYTAGKVASGVGGALAYNGNIISYRQYIIFLWVELIPFLQNDRILLANSEELEISLLRGRIKIIMPFGSTTYGSC